MLGNSEAEFLGTLLVDIQRSVTAAIVFGHSLGLVMGKDLMMVQELY